MKLHKIRSENQFLSPIHSIRLKVGKQYSIPQMRGYNTIVLISEAIYLNRLM
jgi:hypothetical protein